MVLVAEQGFGPVGVFILDDGVRILGPISERTLVTIIEHVAAGG